MVDTERHIRLIITGIITLFLVSLSQTTGTGDKDGAWSPWGLLMTPCLNKNTGEPVKCGGGLQTKFRSCSNPHPSGNGLDCPGNSTAEEACGTDPCQLPGHFLWSGWSECTRKCGIGTQTRYTMCGSVRFKNPENGSDPKVAELKLLELERGIKCSGDLYKEKEQVCNTWDLGLCPPICSTLDASCPSDSRCNETSNSTHPSYECVCQLGTQMKDDKSACIVPPPTTPTPRPIPSLPPEQKTASTVITRGASTLIIIFLAITIILFLALGIFDNSRIIHMNMEISLICAHICLLPSVYEDNPEACRVLSIMTHFSYTACFMFMFLESIHMYSLVAWVVPRDGLLSPGQNTIVGWGIAFVVILFNMCFLYNDYGGTYHCWLQMDSGLLYGQYVPIFVIAILTLAIVEAAGSADNFEKLKSVDKSQRFTAKIMQRSLFIIILMVLVSYVLGTVAEYEQDIYMYSFFTVVNGILGFFVFFFHCSANESVRAKLSRCWRRLCGRGKK